MIVLDTNALAEALKPSPSKIVLHWLAAQEPSAVFITTITEAEVLYGIELLPAGKRKSQLSAIIKKLFCGRLSGPDPLLR
jgi:predicted nucleic acid-binding protein